ncbi:Fur family transcriptional regulator [Amorphus orientalis]|uniref:Ferric uptake regulation protein n=1 Tax=Amorphus orientalis TaxID=649198 RepID=A0AAE4AQ99_9HYPH|nr:Fur family transcriptional regulator [Amorphus orientalis]MDQ0313796.1 Fur family zinc uptake transcriptional regulator [Amorphus orientalis]
MSGIFPDPTHDHHGCAPAAVAAAEEHCRSKGLRLSAMRRAVLEKLAESHAPLGAYDILDRLAESSGRPAPISVYRALSFLTEEGLAHRIESLNAYVACGENHGTAQPLVFLICERCRQVGEAKATDLGIKIDQVARSAGFTPQRATLEIFGICEHCSREPA